MGFETDYENSYVKIGKSFDIHADNCNSVDLHFLHNDYEMKTLTFTQGGTYRNVRVVLKRKGP